MAKREKKSELRLLVSDKVMDLGNLAIAALVFGQFLGDKEFSYFILIIGIVLMIICYIISLAISSQ